MSLEVRDPIHGAIVVDPPEVPILDHPFVQRLRGIKQMGFSELPFPGAVHSRYIHAVGVMHLAGRAFDAAFAHHDFSSGDKRTVYRRCVRLAGLLHDLGHAPFSHCTEFAMPPLADLGITVYRTQEVRRASHEDYTIAILTRSDLAQRIDASQPFTARHVAGLISRDVVVEDDFFVDGGLDVRQVLSQLVSSELDVDRLDYLVRDSYFSGARYGQIDVHWLLSNLTQHIVDDAASLAVQRRSLYAFDDFMVARYHMFVMVYFHHKSVVFEEMLKRYFQGEDCDYAIPADVEAYRQVDDVQLKSHLRQSANRWASAVVDLQPWKRVLELHGTPQEVDLDWAAQRLESAGIDFLSAGSTGKFSRYSVFGQKREAAPPIYVVDESPTAAHPVVRLEDATAVFERYQDERRISRLYVDPDNAAEALKAIGQRPG